MSKPNVKLKDKPSLQSPWDQAIADAQQRIRDFKKAIRAYSEAKKRGDLWPEQQSIDHAQQRATQS
jgi:hypothetical protein